jgi:hypothetical protein
MRLGHLERRDDGWWIIGYTPDPEMGPYRTRREAQDDLNALRRSEPMLRRLLAANGRRLEKLRRQFGLA